MNNSSTVVVKATITTLILLRSVKLSAKVRACTPLSVTKIILHLPYFVDNVFIMYIDTEEECPEGMVYQKCGTACPTTCDNKDEEIICTKQCVHGELLNQTFYKKKKISLQESSK